MNRDRETNGATDAYSDWDAAYLLGALSSEERHEYEAHLAGCPDCSRLVAELAVLPGLLGTVPVNEAVLLDSLPSHPAEPGLSRLLAAARRHRRRGRLLVAGAIVAVAAAAASVALIVPGLVAPVGQAQNTEWTTMRQLVPSPLSASFSLSGQPGGTRIDASCSYASTADGGEERAYGLYLTDRSGTSVLVASWRAGPGTTVPAVATTQLDEQDIATVDIRLEPAGPVLLDAHPSG